MDSLWAAMFKMQDINSRPNTCNTSSCTCSTQVADDDTSQHLFNVVTVFGEEENEIPSPFPFPKHYTPDIELGLQLKNLQPKMLAKLCTRFANVMLMYKRYPSKKDYEHVAQQIVQKYPFLASPLDPDSHVS